MRRRITVVPKFLPFAFNENNSSCFSVTRTDCHVKLKVQKAGQITLRTVTVEMFDLKIKSPCKDCTENVLDLHCVSKKVPTFKLSVTLLNRNRFSKLLHCWKAYEICYKTHSNYQPHLRHVATLAWESKHSNCLQIFITCGRKCKQIAF